MFRWSVIAPKDTKYRFIVEADNNVDNLCNQFGADLCRISRKKYIRRERSEFLLTIIVPVYRARR